jgi:hypothetical protein
LNYGDFVRKVIIALNNLGVQYALTGALAVSYYGRPRTTIDVDVIIKATPSDFERLAEALRRAKLHSEASVLHNAWLSKYRIASFEDRKGLRLDVILTQEDIPRRRATILGLPAYIQEPGPLLLQKLRLIKATTDEEKRAIDRMDVLSILRNVDIDVDVLIDEARRQATFDLLQELLAQAEVE